MAIFINIPKIQNKVQAAITVRNQYLLLLIAALLPFVLFPILGILTNKAALVLTQTWSSEHQMHPLCWNRSDCSLLFWMLRQHLGPTKNCRLTWVWNELQGMGVRGLGPAGRRRQMQMDMNTTYNTRLESGWKFEHSELRKYVCLWKI